MNKLLSILILLIIATSSTPFNPGGYHEPDIFPNWAEEEWILINNINRITNNTNIIDIDDNDISIGYISIFNAIVRQVDPNAQFGYNAVYRKFITITYIPSQNLTASTASFPQTDLIQGQEIPLITITYNKRNSVTIQFHPSLENVNNLSSGNYIEFDD